MSKLTETLRTLLIPLKHTIDNKVNRSEMPNAVLSVNGKAPDEIGNVTVIVPTDTHINALIDAKLGVIENGTY